MSRFVTIGDMIAHYGFDENFGLGEPPQCARGDAEDVYNMYEHVCVLATADELAGQESTDSATSMPPGVPTHPEAEMFAGASGGLLEALCLVVGVARRPGEAEAFWRRRGALAASRKIVDAAITADRGSHAPRRAGAVRAASEREVTAREVRSVFDGLTAYQAGLDRGMRPARAVSEAWYAYGDANRPDPMRTALGYYERARAL